ncbi:hypothetical protein Tco_0132671 [Tanacetum coccineum]
MQEPLPPIYPLLNPTSQKYPKSPASLLPLPNSTNLLKITTFMKDLASLEYSQETEGPYSTNLPSPDDIRRLLELEHVMVDCTIKSQTVTLTPNQILTKELSPDMKQWEVPTFIGDERHLVVCLYLPSPQGESEPKKLTLAETQKGAPHDYVEARQEGALCQSSGSTNLLRRYPRLLPSIRYGYCAASRAGGAAESKVEVESSRSYAQKLAEEKMALLVKAEQERADTAEYKASCHWAVKYLEGGVRIIILLGWMIFARDIRRQLEKQEEKLLKTQYRAEAVEELHEKKLLTVPAAQVPGYNQNAYKELVAAMEAMKLLELPHIAQLERDQDYPIDVIMAGLTLARHATEGAEAQPNYFLKSDVTQLQVPIFSSPRDILNPFALEKEIPLKESLEAHAIRLAKKKGSHRKIVNFWGSLRRLKFAYQVGSSSEAKSLSQYLGFFLDTTYRIWVPSLPLVPAFLGLRVAGSLARTTKSPVQNDTPEL